MTIRDPSVLILGSRYDLTCDFIVAAIRRRGTTYLRVNSEDFLEGTYCLDPINRVFSGDYGGCSFRIQNSTLRHVVLRRPVYLRIFGDNKESSDGLFRKYQWAAFLRNLMLFDNALWTNPLPSTYAAEHKGLQLAIASELGFLVPRTFITNSKEQLDDAFRDSEVVAAKGIDTVLTRTEHSESFGFTTFSTAKELRESQLAAAPLTVQAAVSPKTDIRVTVLGTRVFSVGITGPDGPVPHDWRTLKRSARFVDHKLPVSTEQMCIKIVQRLGLNYGAIDLAHDGKNYWFFEVNPTGEWAWLVDTAGLKIDEAFADHLQG